MSEFCFVYKLRCYIDRCFRCCRITLISSIVNDYILGELGDLLIFAGLKSRAQSSTDKGKKLM